MARTRLSPYPGSRKADRLFESTPEEGSMLRSRLARWIGVAIVGTAAMVTLPQNALGQGSLTTSDGLTLSLTSAGSISALKVGSTNYASAIPSGFYFREAVVASSNMVSNASFESGTSIPTSWSYTNSSSGTWSLDTTNHSAGLRSIKLVVSGTTPKVSPNLLSSTFVAHPNTPYTLAFDVKTYGLSVPLACFAWEQNSSGTWTRRNVASDVGTTPWTTKTLGFTTGPNATHLYLQFFLYNGYGTAWVDNVKVLDVFGGNLARAFAGTVTSGSGVLTQAAAINGLNLNAKFTNVGNAIRVDTTLTDTTGADRGIELTFRLPLDVPGWIWDNDFVTPTAIASGTRYENLDPFFGKQTNEHTHSVYPFATVRNGSASFSLAVPMGPLMERLTYDDSEGFRVVYDLGLSAAATKTPSKATVTFWIYTAKPKWGMRSAAEKYYALNPSSFTSASNLAGGWVLPKANPLSSVPNPQDFGWGYEEGDGDLAFDKAHGILGMHYIDPSTYFRPFSYTTQPPYSTLLSTLNGDTTNFSGTTTDNTPISEMATAVINSSPYDGNGLYHFDYNPYFWYTWGGNHYQIYPSLPDPGIPAPSKFSIIKKYSVDNSISAATAAGDVLNGVFLDDITHVFGNIENYRKPLWAYSTGPLSFSYDTRRPVQYSGYALERFCSWLRGYLNGQGKWLTASVGPFSYSWFAQNFDFLGGEAAGAENLTRAYLRRTQSYGKPWSNVFYNGGSTQLPTAAESLKFFRQALLFGYYPGFLGSYWDSSTTYERDRPLFQLYVPLIRKIAQAGWKPVPYATPSDPSALVERFGNPSTGTFYLTAQNPGSTTSSLTITIDGAGLGIPTTASVAIRELVANTSLATGRSGADLLVSDTIAAGDTQLYQVTVGTTASQPVASFSFSPSSPAVGQPVQFTDTSTNSPTSWSWNFGDGSVWSSQNPSHTYGAAGTYNVTLTARNSSGSSSVARSITIAASASAPVASFSVTPTSQTVGKPVQFTDTSTNSPTSWSWNFGDGSAWSSQNPSHTYWAAGTYSVTLTARNSRGSSSVTHSVTITTATPIASFTFTPTSPVVGQPVQFTDTSTNSPTSWYWKFGDGSVWSSRNPSHTYWAAGSYIVTLKASNGSGSTSVSKTVTIR